MKITPVSSPTQVAQPTPNAQAAADAKARAVAMLQGQPQAQAPTQGQQQETPVANPNNISTEELSAIKPTDNISVESETADTKDIREQAQLDPESQRRLQAIARAESKARARIQQEQGKLKAREAAVKVREAALQLAPAPKEQVDLNEYVPKARLKQDALSVLEEAGVDYNELTNQVINRQPTDPRVTSTIQRLEAKIAQLEDNAKQRDQQYTDQQQQQYQAALKQIRVDATTLVNSDPEFETTRAMGQVKEVVKLIEKTYQRDGIVLSVEDAAREVENFLVNRSLKILELDKIKKAQAAKANAAKPPEKTQQTQQPQKTLTNATSSTRPLTARDRAIAAAEGRKNW